MKQVYATLLNKESNIEDYIRLSPFLDEATGNTVYLQMVSYAEQMCLKTLEKVGSVERYYYYPMEEYIIISIEIKYYE